MFLSYLPIPHSSGCFGQPDEIEKFSTVTEFVIPHCSPGKTDNIIATILAGIGVVL